MELQRGAADRAPVQRREDEEPCGRSQLVDARRDASRRIPSGLESRVELVDIRAQAVLRSRIGGVDRSDDDEPGCHEALHLGHRRDQAAALPCAERREQRRGEIVAALVQHGSLGTAGSRESRHANSMVGGVPLDGDHACRLERAQQAADIPGVQPELRPKRADISLAVPEFPEEPRLAERPVACQEAIVESADTLRDDAVEAAHLRDHRVIHSLTVVRGITERNPRCGSASRVAGSSERRFPAAAAFAVDSMIARQLDEHGRRSDRMLYVMSGSWPVTTMMPVERKRSSRCSTSKGDIFVLSASSSTVRGRSSRCGHDAQPAGIAEGVQQIAGCRELVIGTGDE